MMPEKLPEPAFGGIQLTAPNAGSCAQAASAMKAATM
jgi:hypothetical protein